ncbi:hypothetical protein GN958_ATG05735 [Phytophthora infestans]|uniref:Uncharacterized protein n=1 Tax=Phytophthora infestans TaxID=4787 RepID=A0A8S9V3L5_PHYIN|nr:hypothetical protein GN958_ATG05735 [Phytophthora infestans]
MSVWKFVNATHVRSNESNDASLHLNVLCMIFHRRHTRPKTFSTSTLSDETRALRASSSDVSSPLRGFLLLPRTVVLENADQRHESIFGVVTDLRPHPEPQRLLSSGST